jgi:hypothetical protein
MMQLGPLRPALSRTIDVFSRPAVRMVYYVDIMNHK